MAGGGTLKEKLAKIVREMRKILQEKPESMEGEGIASID
jgi:hypothetical protein